MKMELFEKTIIDSLNRNFHSRTKYFDCEFYTFSELSGIVNEINTCLIFELHRAAMTLTNHLLERLLKLSLIYNEIGIGSKPVEDWDAIFEKPNKVYSSMSLGNTIEQCKKFGLITEEEKVFLFDIIRELMRNGFSHADPIKILNEIPDETIMFHGSLSNPKDIKAVTVNSKIIPFVQAIHIESFAQENATHYFDYVVELINKIDQRLMDKSDGTRSDESN